jgi:hypothetical protein
MVELIYSTLRRDPRDRPEACMVRKQLARIGPALAKANWPLAP